MHIGEHLKHTIDYVAIGTGITVGVNQWVIEILSILNPVLTAISAFLAIVWALIRLYEYFKDKRKGG